VWGTEVGSLQMVLEVLSKQVLVAELVVCPPVFPAPAGHRLDSVMTNLVEIFKILHYRTGCAFRYKEQNSSQIYLDAPELFIF
jgi:hypothetical protein